MKILLFLISFLALQISAKDLNQSVLLQIYGYSFDTVRIDLSQQSIDYIEINTFKDFKKLEILHLEDNKIERIEAGLFTGLDNLRELWLETNKIVSIDKKIFQGLNELELVCMKNNPISALFPTNLRPLCDTNPKCTIKITESCSKKTTIQTTSTTTTKESNFLLLFVIYFINYIFLNDKVKANFTLNGNNGYVDQMIVLHDGSLASKSDKDIIIWNIETKSIIRTLNGPSYVNCLTILPDGRLVSSYRDSTFLIWNTNTGIVSMTLKDPIGIIFISFMCIYF